jgi:hypothetical protein
MTINEIISLVGIVWCSGIIGYVLGSRHGSDSTNKIWQEVYKVDLEGK